MKKLILIFILYFNLQVKSQNTIYCDSIDYIITNNPNELTLGLTWTFNSSEVVDMAIFWSVCDDFNCYSGTGIVAFFNQIQPPFSKLKICYDVIIDYNNGFSSEICSRCDSLEYDQLNNTWNITYTTTNNSNTTSIIEVKNNKITNNKMYNLLGKEILKPKGLYVKNNKLYYEQ